MELRLGELETMIEESKVMGELDLNTLVKRINSFFAAGSSLVPQKLSPTQKVWEVYCEEYRKRYTCDPTRNGKTMGQAKLLVGRLGSEAPEVVRFFMQSKNPRYFSNYYDLGLCLMDAEKLRTQWLTGLSVTKIQTKHLETESEVISQLKRIEEGKV